MSTPKELTPEMIKALNDESFGLDYFSSEHDFLLIDKVGSFIQNDFPALLLFAQEMVDANEPFVFGKEDDAEEDSKPSIHYEDEEVATHFGYTVVCNSPMELEGKNGEFLSQECAKFMISHLRTEYTKLKEQA